MADPAISPAPASLNRTWITVITMMALAFNAAVILYVILAGSDDNSLHTSALAWAWGSALIILTGLGIGSSLTTILEFFRPVR